MMRRGLLSLAAALMTVSAFTATVAVMTVGSTGTVQVA